MPGASEFITIEGTLMKVSNQGSFYDEKNQYVSDYYYLGLKTQGGDRIMVYISTAIMGTTGDFVKSKIWYFNAKKGREMKTALSNPEQFIGKRFRVTGFLETLNKEQRKYRMSRVQKVVIFIDT
jgi:hypothetical protein